jgi:hypothetical protein
MNSISKSIAFFLLAVHGFAQPAPAKRPKLVLAITVDQFRYDYLTRFRSDYKAGLAKMLENGAVFTNATYEHFPTVTAVGHSTILSGATPSISGIVGNEWYDRETGRQVSSVSDTAAPLLGGTPGQIGSSPRRLLVSTIGDELKMLNANARVVGISSKDRSAILPVGRMADGAYWFDTLTGNFVSSTYYFPQLPGWAAKWNASRAADKYVGKEWVPFDVQPNTPARAFRRLGLTPDKAYFDSLERTPWGNEIIELFAEAAVEGEKIGQDDITDLLSVSFSSNDRIGHAVGPDAPEIRDISVQTDRLLGKMFEFLDARVGVGSYLVVLTADHGVAPMPEVMQKRRMPGGRMPEGGVIGAVQEALVRKYGQGQWVVGKSGPAPYLNYGLVNERKLNLEEVQNTAAAAVRAVPHIYRVYTKTELQYARVLDDMIDRRVRAGFHDQRASDLFIVAEPYWLFEAAGTSHGTPYNYDAHVPVVFMGSGVKPGQYHAKVAVNDIAPTLATMLAIETPSGSSGRVLSEMLQ